MSDASTTFLACTGCGGEEFRRCFVGGGSEWDWRCARCGKAWSPGHGYAARGEPSAVSDPAAYYQKRYMRSNRKRRKAEPETP